MGVCRLNPPPSGLAYELSKEDQRLGRLHHGTARRRRGVAGPLRGLDRHHGPHRRPLPLGTVIINITGSFLIGLLMTLLTERWSPHPNLRLLLVTGFLGGYTTFSSFEWETLALVRGGGRGWGW